MTWTLIDTILITEEWDENVIIEPVPESMESSLQAAGNWWIFLLQALCVVGITWVMFHHTYFHNERNELPDVDVYARIQERLEKWDPEDLVPSNVIRERILNPKVLAGKAKKRIKVNNRTCLNLSTMNFLDLIGSEEIEDRAVEAIERYGVGSCGPRGFYGTVESHLDLELRLARFMDTEDAIVYSYGFSCIASAIPAYAKRHDIIFADERVNFAIQKGLFASRSTIRYFRHNNHTDLEVLLMNQEHEDKKNPEKAAKIRRFVIIEGIYMNTGELVDLPYYIVLKERYKFRLFIDESISFGTVCYGRGVTRYYNIPITKVDMIMASLEYAVGSIGGFCCGSKFIIEHQRLSGLGYCFSASQPPLHAVAALKAIDIMEDIPMIFTELTTACKSMSISLHKLRGMKLKGWDESPVKHLYLCSSHIGDDPQDEILQKISDYCFRHGFAITSPSYIEKEEKYDPIPSLRICVNRSFEQADIEEAAHILQSALDEIELNFETKDDDPETRKQKRREARRRVRREREAIRTAHQRGREEAPQPLQEETNRANQEQGEAPQQQQEEISQQVILDNRQQEQEARATHSVEGHHEQVRRTHRRQTGSNHPRTGEDQNQQRRQTAETAHMEEIMDNRALQAHEEHRLDVQEAFRLIRAREIMTWSPEEARQARESRRIEEEEYRQVQALLNPGNPERQAQQGDTRQLDQEDNRRREHDDTRQIRQRSHQE